MTKRITKILRSWQKELLSPKDVHQYKVLYGTVGNIPKIKKLVHTKQVRSKLTIETPEQGVKYVQS